MTSTTSDVQKHRCKRFSHFLTNINFFDEKDDLSLGDQLLATKIFLVSFITTLTIVVFSTAFTFQTKTVIVQSPSETIFIDLSLQYPSTFSCSCRESSIRQDQFLSFYPQYHPICSSQLINPTFIGSSLSDMNMSDYWPTDYRLMAASHLQILTLLCRTVNQTIMNALVEFADRHIITPQALFRDVFAMKIEGLVEELKTTTVTSNKHRSDFVWSSIVQNEIHTALRSNYYVLYIPDTTTIQGWPTSYQYLNQTCRCRSTDTCIGQAGIYNWTGRAGVNATTVFGRVIYDPLSLLEVPGMMTGCFPYSSLLKSTLECFYQQSCLDLLQTFIPGLSFISPISSTSSRFTENTTVENLSNQLFVESWNNQSNFTKYLQACSPQSCSYSYDQRFIWIYVIITLIGFFGGLKISTFSVAPFAVKFVQKLQKTIRRCRHNKVDQTSIVDEVHSKSFKEIVLSFPHEIHQRLVTFNLFPLASNIKDGIYATRTYIMLLIIAILVLVSYTSISLQVQSFTVYQPSLKVYEELYDQYPSALVCPCTRFSMSYQSIMNVQVRYHQVCASDFVKNDGWLLYTNGMTGHLSSSDFRVSGIRLFILLQRLCQMSNETVINELDVFNNRQFVSAKVLANSTFRMQISSIINQFQQQTVFYFLDLFRLIQASIQLNQFYVYGQSNARLYRTLSYDKWSVRIVAKNNFDNGCSCGTSSTCTRAQGFYCMASSCKTVSAKPNQTIPGLVSSCLIVDSLLASSLQCFYNASCIRMIIEWRSFEINNNASLSRLLNLTALDPMIESRFSPETTLDQIVSQLFIEDWSISTNFTAYYEQCAPNECTYTYQERFNIPYLISNIFGILGGLSVALRIFIPPIVKLLRLTYNHCHRSRKTGPREAFVETDTDQKFSAFINHFRHSLQTMNLYRQRPKPGMSEESSSNNETLTIKQQHEATRFYIILLCLAIIVILIFTIFRTQTHLITIISPTESMFESLQTQYSSTLSCPCSHVVISYSKFLFVRPLTYHQICASYFISSNFSLLLWRTETLSDYFWYRDSKILSTQFRLLSTLCSLAKNVVDQKIEIFTAQELVSLETLDRNSFQSQIDAIITSFIIQTPANFRRLHQYVNDMLHVNQLQNIFYTNWNVTNSVSEDALIMSTYPIEYNESGHACSCATSSTCSRSTLVKRNQRGAISGLVIGCLPVFGLRQSTLGCFYNSTCLEGLAAFIGTSTVFSPLNDSINSRFTPISSVSFGTLIDEMFIESWERTNNYSGYFTSCAPSSCRYTYVERSNVIYILTTFLGLYGGLTVAIKFLVLHFLNFYWKIRLQLS